MCMVELIEQQKNVFEIEKNRYKLLISVADALKNFLCVAEHLV